MNEFHSLFGHSENVTEVLAPGRINLIGEHTDYNGGFVMPCAIGQHIRIRLAPNGKSVCRVVSLQVDEGAMLEFPSAVVAPGIVRGMTGYLMGVVHGIRQLGSEVGGFDVLLDSTIPAGAGLSSSAALCCGVGFAISEAFHLDIPRRELALIAQQAEHLFAGVRCGLMDQYAVLFGQERRALLLDCRSLEFDYIPVELPGYEWLLVDSRVHHELASSAYNDRRAACETGVAVLSRCSGRPIGSLREIDAGLLESLRAHLPSDVHRRCAFVVSEISRTRQAAALLRQGDAQAFGRLMYATHEGLSQEYEVSCEETDELVRIAASSGIVAGARMMGGGFGGCTLNLIRHEAVSTFTAEVSRKYLARFGKEPHFYPVAIGPGVCRV